MRKGAGRTEYPPGAALFSYHRAVAPMMWVLFGLICIEATVTHVLIALWRPPVALFLSAFSLVLALWLGVMIRSMRTHPVSLRRGELVWPAGSIRAIVISLFQVSRRVDHWTLDSLRREGLFNAALIAYPNIVLELDPPARLGRRTVRYVAHRLDDPQAFNAALDALLPAHDRLH
jgi:hypothetical protein